MVQRWTGIVAASEAGGFVAYGDYLTLQEECNELRQALESLMQERDAAVAELSKVTDELFALSQDDGKIERALDRANEEIARLKAQASRELAIYETVGKDVGIKQENTKGCIRSMTELILLAQAEAMKKN
jgi:chromosome segregation ATPase